MTLDLKNLSSQHLTAKRDLLKAEIIRSAHQLAEMQREYEQIVELLSKKGETNDKVG